MILCLWVNYMKRMFIKVYMNDNDGDTLAVHEAEVKQIEKDVKQYLKENDYQAFFFYHQASYEGIDFIEITHEGDINDEVINKLKELLINMTVVGGKKRVKREVTLNLDSSLKYINFIKIDNIITL